MQLDQYDDVFKIILVGDSGVGKSNLIHHYTKQKIANNLMPTVGVQYTSKIVALKDNKRAKVQIWDTAGQQQYRSITMTHYKKALGALVVFDLTNRRSFESVQYWVNIVKERANQNVQIGIVGNKTDLSSARREVNRQQAERLASSFHAFYTQTSAKQLASIKHAFETLTENVDKVHRNHRDDHFVDNQRLQVNNNANQGCKC